MLPTVSPSSYTNTPSSSILVDQALSPSSLHPHQEEKGRQGQYDVGRGEDSRMTRRSLPNFISITLGSYPYSKSTERQQTQASQVNLQQRQAHRQHATGSISHGSSLRSADSSSDQDKHDLPQCLTTFDEGDALELLTLSREVAQMTAQYVQSASAVAASRGGSHSQSLLRQLHNPRYRHILLDVPELRQLLVNIENRRLRIYQLQRKRRGPDAGQSSDSTTILVPPPTTSTTSASSAPVPPSLVSGSTEDRHVVQTSNTTLLWDNGPSQTTSVLSSSLHPGSSSSPSNPQASSLNEGNATPSPPRPLGLESTDKHGDKEGTNVISVGELIDQMRALSDELAWKRETQLGGRNSEMLQKNDAKESVRGVSKAITIEDTENKRKEEDARINSAITRANLVMAEANGGVRQEVEPSILDQIHSITALDDEELGLLSLPDIDDEPFHATHSSPSYVTPAPVHDFTLDHSPLLTIAESSATAANDTYLRTS